MRNGIIRSTAAGFVGLLGLLQVAAGCGSDEGSSNEAVGGSAGQASGGTAGSAGQASGGTAGSAGQGGQAGTGGANDAGLDATPDDAESDAPSESGPDGSAEGGADDASVVDAADDAAKPDVQSEASLVDVVKPDGPVQKGSIVVNRVGHDEEVTVTITGAATYNLTTNNGVVVQSGVPAGTYTVKCGNVPPYTMTVANKDNTIDTAGEALTFTCNYAWAPKFCAAGGGVFCSVDGSSWSGNLMTLSTTGVTHIAYGGGRYVAIESHNAFVSTDGRNWTKHVHPTVADPAGIVFAHGEFVLVEQSGNIFTDANGIYWTKATLPAVILNGLSRVSVCGSRIVVLPSAASEKVLYSDNATTWFAGMATGGAIPMAGAAYHPGVFAHYRVVGRDIGFWSFDAGEGDDWHQSNPGGAWLNGLTYGEERFVAVGDSGRITWSKYDVMTKWNDVGAAGASLQAVTYGHGKFVAVGDAGAVRYSDLAEGPWASAAKKPATAAALLSVIPIQ